MTSTFVILAAGRGTRIGRVGESLHKALVPLGGKAVISHLFELAPPDARIIVAVGHRAEQIKAYVTLAHPKKDVEFVYVDGWDEPGGGPGWSLLAALDRDRIDGNLIFTTCDTLWPMYENLENNCGTSWAAVAPVPAGTPPARWCRIEESPLGKATDVIDKQPGGEGFAYIGLAHILNEDLDLFLHGIQGGELLAGETQVSGGLAVLATSNRLATRHMHWTDVGDEAAYRRAVAQYTGYDWTKLDEATYILPDEERVVKFWADDAERDRRQRRATLLAGAVPDFIQSMDGMLAYKFVRGETAYRTAEYDTLLPKRVLAWAEEHLWHMVPIDEEIRYAAAVEFYLNKTRQRIEMLPPDLKAQCLDVTSRVVWDDLCRHVEACTWHGDLNYGNLITVPRGFVGVDWRGEFAGHVTWGDRRYDIAKLLAGTVVHWDNARRGDFRPWPAGEHHAQAIREWMGDRRDIEIIAALHLLNSAPLHASPLDEILVARGVAWLEEVA